MKASHNWLKVTLALEVKKLGLASVISKLGEFPLFDSFLDLTNFLSFEFLDLNNFLVIVNFPYFSIDLSSSLTIPTSLAATNLLTTSTYDKTVVFSIDISGAAILLKP